MSNNNANRIDLGVKKVVKHGKVDAILVPKRYRLAGHYVKVVLWLVG